MHLTFILCHCLIKLDLLQGDNSYSIKWITNLNQLRQKQINSEQQKIGIIVAFCSPDPQNTVHTIYYQVKNTNYIK